MAYTARAESPSTFQNVKCEGSYPGHLQGICTNSEDSIYWSFTTVLVKTDRNGKVRKKVPVANHHGDLCYHDCKIPVAVNLGKFNDPRGNADSWVYVYDADNLSELARHRTPEVFHGAGGIAYSDGRFLVVGGLPEEIHENYAYEYDKQFRFVKRHVIQSGHTLMGIQTAAYANGFWWFGCYGNPPTLLKTDRDFQLKGKFPLNVALGIVGVGQERFLIAKGTCQKGKGCTAEVMLAKPDPAKGLVPLPKP